MFLLISYLSITATLYHNHCNNQFENVSCTFLLNSSIKSNEHTNQYSKLTYVKVCLKEGSSLKNKIGSEDLSGQRKFKFQNRKIPLSSSLWKGNSSVSKGSWSLTNRKLSHSPPKRVPSPSNTLRERYWKASENLPALPSSSLWMSWELQQHDTRLWSLKSPLFFRAMHQNIYSGYYVSASK